jgi:hypothetical protein
MVADTDKTKPLEHPPDWPEGPEMVKESDVGAGNFPKKRLSLRWVFVILAILSFVFATREYQQYIYVEGLKSIAADQTEEYVKLISNKLVAKQLYQNVYNELNELKTRDEKCIAIYIKERYTSTPRVIAEEVAKVIVQKAKEHSVQIPLIVGMIETESQFNPYAESSTKARGLMQVMFSVWGEELAIEKEADLHEINIGIDAGIRVLKKYLVETEGNLTKTLWKYNGKAADKTKYAKLVFENVGRYTLYPVVKFTTD